MQSTKSPTAQDQDISQLIKALSTAFVSTRGESANNPREEIVKLVESAEFRAIAISVRELAQSLKISDKEAAERVIETFRKADSLWARVLAIEGIERLKGNR